MLAAIGLRFVNKLQHNLFTFLDEDSLVTTDIPYILVEYSK